MKCPKCRKRMVVVLSEKEQYNSSIIRVTLMCDDCFIYVDKTAKEVRVK